MTSISLFGFAIIALALYLHRSFPRSSRGWRLPDLRRPVMLLLLLGLGSARLLAAVGTLTSLAINQNNSPLQLAYVTPVLATATVTASDGVTPVTGGFVQFRDGDAVVATVAVNSSGVATFQRPYYPGVHLLRARYAGTNGYAPSISAAQSITVNPLQALSVSSGYSSCDQYLRFSLAATGSSVAPTGTTSFSNGRTGASSQPALGASGISTSWKTQATALNVVGATDGSAITSGTASGNFVSALATADLNNDGVPDYIVAGGSANKVTIYSGSTTTGSPNTTAAGTITVNAGAFGVATGDFNADGKGDIAVALSNGTVQFLYGNADYTFSSKPGFPLVVSGTGTSPKAIVTADFDGDGALDVAVADAGGNVYVLSALGSGSPVVRTLALGGTLSAVVAGDFNNDGRQDLAITSRSANTVSIFLSSGPGSIFASSPSSTVSLPAGAAPSAIAAGDPNRSGFLSLAVADAGTGQVSVLRGDGSGAFVLNSSFASAGTVPSAIAFVDYNGDGYLDILVLNYGDGTPGATQYRTNPTNNNLGIFTGAGTLSFTSYVTPGYAINSRPLSLATTFAPNTASTIVATLGAADPTNLSSTGTLGTFYFSSVANSASNYLYHQYATDAITTVYQPTGGSIFSSMTNIFNANSGDISDVALGAPVPAVSFGANSTLTAQVTDLTNGTRIPSGTVAFCSGNNFIGTATVNGTGGATLTTSIIPTGTAPLTALYLSNRTTTYQHAVSTSGTITIPAIASATSAPPFALASSASANTPPDTTLAGTTVALTATATGITVGSISFYNGSVLLGSAPVNGSGVATYNVKLGAGQYTLAARFAGNNQSLPATATVPLTVTSPSPVTTLTAAGDPCNGYTLSAQVVSGISALVGQLTGDVQFTDQTTGALLGTVAVTSATLNAIQFDPLARTSLGTYGAYPSATSVGDFDADGNLDLVIRLTGKDIYGNSGDVFRGTGTGSFVQVLSFNPNGNPIFTADLNGDGKIDLLSGANVYLNASTGAGSFAFPYSVAVPTPEGSCAVADFNGDNRPDLACTNAGVLTITPNSTFLSLQNFAIYTVPGTQLGDPAYGMGTVAAPTSADLNSDGKMDLIIRQGGSVNAVMVLLGNGDGTFTRAPGSGFATDPTGSYYGDYQVGDFNGDGDPDLVFFNATKNNITTYLGNGDGTFTYAFSRTVATGVTLSHIYQGDLNVDGKIDILGLHNDSFTTYIGNGDGSFIDKGDTLIGTGYAPNFLQVADVNGDAKADVISVNYGVDTISVLLNTTQMNPSGTAQIAIPTSGVLPVSNPLYGHNIVATYLGSPAGTIGQVFTPSADSSPVVLTKQPTAMTLGTSLTPAPFARNVTITGTVNGACTVTGAPAPSGGLQFADNGSPIGSLATLTTGGTATYASSSLSVGTHPVTASYAGDNVYAASTSTPLNQVISKATPTLSYTPVPATQSFGAALPSTSLNASAVNAAGTAVAGTFVYTAVIGGTTITLTAGMTSLPAGTYTVTAAFTPADTTLYNSASTTATYTVTRQAPTLAYAPNPATQVYGSAIVAGSMNATATNAAGTTLTGTFTYRVTLNGTPTTLVAGSTVLPVATYTVTASFTPTDAANYSSGTATATYTVTPQTPVLTYTPNPATQIYGVAIVSGSLNATAKDANNAPVAGSFAYTTSVGSTATTLVAGTTVLPAATYTITATFTPTDTTTYIGAGTTTGAYTVTPATPVLTYTPTVTTQVYGAAIPAGALNATAATSGGTAISGSFSYSTSVNGTVTTLVPGVTVLPAGSYTITASFTPADTTNFVSGGTATAGFSVTRATPVVTYAPNPATQVYGGAVASTSLNASAADANGNAVAGSFSYSTSVNGTVTTLVPGVTVLPAGSYTITASFTPADTTNFVSGGTATAGFSVTRATPVVTYAPNPATQVYSGAVASTSLNASAADANGNPIAGSFSYSTSVNGVSTPVTSATVLPVGSYTVIATFTPAAPANFNPATGTAGYTVTPAAPTLAYLPNPLTQVYGGAMVAGSLNATAGDANGAPIAGSFAYSTVVNGTVTPLLPGVTALPGGSYFLTATFTSANPGFQSGGTATASYTVTPATPAISYTAFPSAQIYGQPLPGTMLAATAVDANGNPVAGSFTYTAVVNGTATTLAVGATLPVGDYTITASFVPSQPANFATATASSVVHITPATSAMSLLSSANPSTFGASTYFAATVATVNGTVPTGTITFFDGSTPLGTVALDPTGRAVSPATTLAAGTHAITAQYSGDPIYPAASAHLSQQITQAATTTVLQTSPGSTTFGQSVALTATVASAAPGTLMGTVSFFDGNALLGSSPLLPNGTAVLSTAALTAGSHSLTAVYSGDASNAGSTSPAVNQSITRGSVSVGLVSSTPAATQGLAMPVLTATVTAPTGGVVPTGDINFFDGATLLGQASINASGVASFQPATLSTGSHIITAVYAGDENNATSSSAAVAQIVNKAATVTTLTTSTATSTPGQNVTLMVTASSPALGPASGTVTLMDGGTLLGTVTLDGNGAGTLTLSSLPPGTHTITAQYGGDATTLSPSASAPVATTVSDFSIAALPNSMSVLPGAAVATTLQLAAITGSFDSPITLSVTGLPNGATASFSTPSVTPGAATAKPTMTVQTAALVAGTTRGNAMGAMGYTALGLLLLPLATVRRLRHGARKLPRLMLLLAVLSLGVAAGLTGCAGGYFGANPKTYTLTVTGTSGTLQHSTTVTLTVE